MCPGGMGRCCFLEELGEGASTKNGAILLHEGIKRIVSWKNGRGCFLDEWSQGTSWNNGARLLSGGMGCGCFLE